MLLKSEIINYYDILEIPVGSDIDTIKKAYKDLCLIWHPDRHPERVKQRTTGKMRKLNEAYEMLSKINSKRFDHSRQIIENWNFKGKRQHWHFGNEMAKNELIKMFDKLTANLDDVYAVADSTLSKTQRSGCYFTPYGIISIKCTMDCILGKNEFAFVRWEELSELFENSRLEISCYGFSTEANDFNWWMESDSDSERFISYLCNEFNNNNQY